MTKHKKLYVYEQWAFFFFKRKKKKKEKPLLTRMEKGLVMGLREGRREGITPKKEKQRFAVTVTIQTCQNLLQLASCRFVSCVIS